MFLEDRLVESAATQGKSDGTAHAQHDALILGLVRGADMAAHMGFYSGVAAAMAAVPVNARYCRLSPVSVCRPYLAFLFFYHLRAAEYMYDQPSRCAATRDKLQALMAAYQPHVTDAQWEPLNDLVPAACAKFKLLAAQAGILSALPPLPRAPEVTGSVAAAAGTLTPAQLNSISF